MRTRTRSALRSYYGGYRNNKLERRLRSRGGGTADRLLNKKYGGTGTAGQKGH